MLVNWGLEAKKWQVLVQSIQPISYFRAYKAILSGQALALNTPNRVGEYAGRIIYLEEGNRLRGITLLLVANISQLIITFVLGFIGLVLMQNTIENHLQQLEHMPVYSYRVLMFSVGIFTGAFLLFYYNLSWVTLLVERIKWVKKYRFFIQKLEDLHYKELTKILSLSLIRYLVFVWQYILLFQVFNVSIFWWQASGLVCVQFLVMAIIPSIALGELGVRGKVGIALFGLLSNNTLGIIATSAGIWLINLIIPAVAGSLFMLGIRIFRNKT